jgi:hypothetical protein
MQSASVPNYKQSIEAVQNEVITCWGAQQCLCLKVMMFLARLAVTASSFSIAFILQTPTRTVPAVFGVRML